MMQIRPIEVTKDRITVANTMSPFVTWDPGKSHSVEA